MSGARYVYSIELRESILVTFFDATLVITPSACLTNSRLSRPAKKVTRKATDNPTKTLVKLLTKFLRFERIDNIKNIQRANGT
jgi:hypothetical protein